jgi:hypothetical protein
LKVCLGCPAAMFLRPIWLVLYSGCLCSGGAGTVKWHSQLTFNLFHKVAKAHTFGCKLASHLSFCLILCCLMSFLQNFLSDLDILLWTTGEPFPIHNIIRSSKEKLVFDFMWQPLDICSVLPQEGNSLLSTNMDPKFDPAEFSFSVSSSYVSALWMYFKIKKWINRYKIVRWLICLPRNQIVFHVVWYYSEGDQINCHAEKYYRSNEWLLTSEEANANCLLNPLLKCQYIHRLRGRCCCGSSLQSRWRRSCRENHFLLIK